MKSYLISGIFIAAAACTAAVPYLTVVFRRDRRIIALVGLFCMAMGLLLLTLDLLLISFTLGPELIADYLLFNRLVSDTGFAGRWVLTAYLFMVTGPVIGIYLLAAKTISKFNKAAFK